MGLYITEELGGVEYLAGEALLFLTRIHFCSNILLG